MAAGSTEGGGTPTARSASAGAAAHYRNAASASAACRTPARASARLSGAAAHWAGTPAAAAAAVAFSRVGALASSGSACGFVSSRTRASTDWAQCSRAARSAARLGSAPNTGTEGCIGGAWCGTAKRHLADRTAARRSSRAGRVGLLRSVWQVVGAGASAAGDREIGATRGTEDSVAAARRRRGAAEPGCPQAAVGRQPGRRGAVTRGRWSNRTALRSGAVPHFRCT